MASPISGLGGSGLSSIYGRRNVISGLASGMDTESMIEHAISGYKMKISTLRQKQTGVMWQQESLRSIIDKMATFNRKYFSFESGSNLSSSSFFDSAVKISTNGKYADKISATGKPSSDIEILGVDRLATSTTYKVPGLNGTNNIIKGEAFSLNDSVTTSNMTGEITLSNGQDDSVTVQLTPEDMKDIKDAKGLAEKINEKLSSFKTPDGTQKIKAEVKDGNIEFVGLNDAHITAASGKIKDALSINPGKDATKLTIPGNAQWETSVPKADELDGKELNITLDGKTKSITLKTKDENGRTLTDAEFMANLQKEVNAQFGQGKVELKNLDTNGKIQLQFEVQAGSTLVVTSPVGETLGLSSNYETNYTNPNHTLGQVLGSSSNAWKADERTKAVGDPKNFKELEEIDGKKYFEDAEGKRVVLDTDGNYYRVDSKNSFMYDFKINGTTVGSFSENTSLQTVISTINRNTDAGVSVSFSQTTNEFTFTARESGSNGKIEFGGALATTLFGNGQKTDGQDAQFTMKVNGKEMTTTRPDNSFTIDGLNLTLKGTFSKDENEPVTFTSTTDSEKLVDAIKDFVKDYNEMVTEIRKAYNTTPSLKTNGQRYEPLTDEERADLSETAIKNYEEKAKAGILFADRDLSGLYNSLNDAVSLSGADRSFLKSIGMTFTFKEGTTTISLDEEKLKTALDANPEKIKEMFTRSKANGAASDGMMESLRKSLDEYGATMGSRKGILVERAGSVHSPASIHTNTMQQMINEYENQITRWTDKMSNQVDYYTSKFTQLEQLIAQMNAQSSTLAGLMMGGG